MKIFQNAEKFNFGSGYFLNAWGYQLDFLRVFLLCYYAVQRVIFLKSEQPLLLLPTYFVADPNTFQIFF